MDESPSSLSAITPFIGVITTLIGWTFFLIALSMFKNFLSHGFSMAIAEFLLKHANTDQREKIARWFGNGDDIMDTLANLDEKLQPDDMPSSKTRKKSKSTE